MLRTTEYIQSQKEIPNVHVHIKNQKLIQTVKEMIKIDLFPKLKTCYQRRYGFKEEFQSFFNKTS